MLHGIVGKCYRWCHNKSLGLLVLRLALGAFFIGHAVAKFQNLPATVEMFQGWGFGAFWAYLATGSELLAGLLLVLGAFLWIAAALVVVVMAVAVYAVTGPNPMGQPPLLHYIFGWGQNAVFAAAALALAFTGAGRWSLAAWWMRRRSGSVECRECKSDHGMGCNCGSCSEHHGMSSRSEMSAQ
ncbi:MAG: DoxX family membrane protein [Candidatus Yanofskybacteria bacterium]|nr:DoxX family membrane protein [Candidatus Yanofskybacteria bacterium]